MVKRQKKSNDEINYNDYINFIGIEEEDKKTGIFTYTDGIKFAGYIYKDGKIIGELRIGKHKKLVEKHITNNNMNDDTNNNINYNSKNNFIVFNKNDIIIL